MEVTVGRDGIMFIFFGRFSTIQKISFQTLVQHEFFGILYSRRSRNHQLSLLTLEVDINKQSSNEVEDDIEHYKGREGVFTIEIINNTRGGIVILIQSKKGNTVIGGTNSSPGCVLVFPLVTSFNLANESMILYPGPKFAPPPD